MKRAFLFLNIILLQFTIRVTAQEWIAMESGIPATARTEVTGAPQGVTEVRVNLEGFFRQGILTDEGFSGHILLPEGVKEMEAGKPSLQHLTVSLQIPGTGNPVITLTAGEYTDYENYIVVPASGDPGETHRRRLTRNVRKAIYSNDEFYPGALASAGTPYIVTGIRGLAVQIYPLQYNPVTRTLRVYHSIVLTVSTTEEKGINEITGQQPGSQQGSGISALLSSHFLNYSNNSRYTPVDEGGGMLIISPPAFFETLRPFTDWKAQTGIRCTVADATMFRTAEELKNYVAEFYNNNNLTYLLLAGDADFIPAMQAEKGASDNMYAYLDGDDHYPEILVGRFPAETETQLKIMIERSIAYEMKGQGAESYSRFLGIASEQGPGDDGEYDYQHVRNIGSLLTANGYSAFTELYDGSQGQSDAPGNPVPGDVTAAVASGAGTIMYIGHGSSSRFTTSGFAVQHAKTLSNTVTHPVIWSAGCSTGDFVTTTSLAEAWLRAESNGKPSGAVAAMMSTSTQSWYPPMEAQDEIGYILAGRRGQVTTRTFGGVSMSGCMKMNDKYGPGGYRVTDTWAIFGDPSLLVRTAAPEDIRAHHQPVIGRDAREFVVKLPANSDALACITHSGSLLGAARAEEGLAVITLSDLPTAESLTLTITSFNHKAYVAEIILTPLPATAVNPFPLNHSGKVEPGTALQWETTGGTTPEFFEVLIEEGPVTEWKSSGLISFSSCLTLSAPLEYNKTYSWKVRSYNQSGMAESETFTFTTKTPPDEDFESQGFPRRNWDNTSNSAWFIDGNNAFEGQYSLRSGQIRDGEQSRLAYSCKTTTCDMLGFSFRISSEQSADRLKLYIDGILTGEWSGNAGWTSVTFPIEAGDHTIEWIYEKNDSLSLGEDAAWIDNIYLPENSEPVVTVSDITACPESSINLSAFIRNHRRIEWSSNGTGDFLDSSAPATVYFPSADELAAGSASLILKVYSNDFCNPVIRDVTIHFDALQEIPAVRDTILYHGEQLVIELPGNGTEQYSLSPSNQMGTTFVIKAADLNPGENLFTLSAENESGCSSAVSFRVMLASGERSENPKQLQVYPNPAVDMISFNLDQNIGSRLKIQIYNVSGQLMMESETTASFKNEIPVGGLMSGVYLIRVEDGRGITNGKFIKTI